MTIQEYNYDIFQGDTWQVTIPLTDIDGNPVSNAANWNFVSQVRDKEKGDILCASASLGSGITTSVVNSQVNVTVVYTPTQTANFNLPKSVYQIQSIDPAGRKKTLRTGWLQIHPSIIQ
mgnify:CR=1 FL=1